MLIEYIARFGVGWFNSTPSTHTSLGVKYIKNEVKYEKTKEKTIDTKTKTKDF